jgi:beta-lactamase regulating signal transducer with metallopeptidase domain
MDAVLVVKASIVLAATLAAAWLLRRAPAVTRHRLWTLGFAAVLALPILAVAMPALYVPVPSCCAGSTVGPETSGTAAGSTPAAATTPAHAVAGPAIPIAQDLPPAPRAARFALPSARLLLVLAWLAGTFAAAAVLLLSLLRVRRLATSAAPLDDTSWIAATAALAAQLGLRRRVRLLVSARVGTPMAGGLWRPTIFLPAAAPGWTDERRDVVLAHELAHLAGHDPLRHVAARLAVALYWFHPLAWMAARRAAAAREQACDEAVLSLGTRPSDYARVLLDMADAMPPASPRLAALPMVHPSHLETRLMAILNDDVRAGRARRMAIPATVFALSTLVLGAAQPMMQASAVLPPAVSEDTPAPADVRPASVAASTGATVTPAAAEVQAATDAECAWDGVRRGSFRGRTSTSRNLIGRVVINEQIGTSGDNRIVQKDFGDLQVCMVAEDAAGADGERPSQWLGRGRRVVLEARRGTSSVQRLEVAPYGTGQRVSWQVNGSDRPFDAAAQQWRDRLLAVLDTTWEVATLHGEVSSLHGDISSLRGEESSLRGEISSLNGEVSSMRGRQSSVRGDESSLRGEISAIRGHVSSLQGSISSARGTISSLRAGDFRTDESAAIRDLVARRESEIARLEAEIRDYNADARVAAVEKEIAALDAGKKAAAIDAEIRAFDLDGKVAAIEKQIAALDVDGKTRVLEGRIDALDADRRVRQLELRQADELKQLAAAIAAIR